MSVGQPWIDKVIIPLSPFGEFELSTAAYNRIYEAVGRGSEQEGHALVAAIVESLRAERRRAEVER